MSEKGWPRYRSHKIVEALKITAAPVEVGSHLRIEVAGEIGNVLVDHKVCSRYMPVPGDCLVRYEDGYLSISPGKGFDDGYIAIDDEAPFVPGDLVELKSGGPRMTAGRIDASNGLCAQWFGANGDVYVGWFHPGQLKRA